MILSQNLPEIAIHPLVSYNEQSPSLISPEKTL
mgnify:CR=1 FL=1